MNTTNRRTKMNSLILYPLRRNQGSRNTSHDHAEGGCSGGVGHNGHSGSGGRRAQEVEAEERMAVEASAPHFAQIRQGLRDPSPEAVADRRRFGIRYASFA